jgi:hypothetical protein
MVGHGGFLAHQWGQIMYPPTTNHWTRAKRLRQVVLRVVDGTEPGQQGLVAHCHNLARGTAEITLSARHLRV